VAPSPPSPPQAAITIANATASHSHRYFFIPLLLLVSSGVFPCLRRVTPAY
jgi:hypothetical protein